MSASARASTSAAQSGHVAGSGSRTSTAEQRYTAQAVPRHHLPTLRRRRRQILDTLARVFQIGSAESGSTIKVRSAWLAADGRPANGRTCPPIPLPKVIRHNGGVEWIVSPTSWSMITSSPAATFQGCRWRSARPGLAELPLPPTRPAVQHMQLYRLNDRRQLQRLEWMQLAVERDPLADDPIRACRLVHHCFLRVAFDEPEFCRGSRFPEPFYHTVRNAGPTGSPEPGPRRCVCSRSSRQRAAQIALRCTPFGLIPVSVKALSRGVRLDASGPEATAPAPCPDRRSLRPSRTSRTPTRSPEAQRTASGSAGTTSLSAHRRKSSRNKNVGLPQAIARPSSTITP